MAATPSRPASTPMTSSHAKRLRRSSTSSTPRTTWTTRPPTLPSELSPTLLLHLSPSILPISPSTLPRLSPSISHPFSHPFWLWVGHPACSRAPRWPGPLHGLRLPPAHHGAPLRVRERSAPVNGRVFHHPLSSCAPVCECPAALGWWSGRCPSPPGEGGVTDPRAARLGNPVLPPKGPATPNIFRS